LLDQVHVAVGPAHHVGVAVCGGVEPEGLAHDVRDAFGFGLPPAPVQVLADAGAGEVVAADVRQFVDGGLEPLRGAHVVADQHEHQVAADGDTVGTAQVWTARCGQFEAVSGVLDEFDGVVEGVGRVVTGQQLGRAGAAEALATQPRHGGYLERFPVGLRQVEGGGQPESHDLYCGATVRVAAHFAADGLPFGGLFLGGAALDRCPYLERRFAVADLPVVFEPPGAAVLLAVGQEELRGDAALVGLHHQQQLVAQAVAGAEERDLVDERRPLPWVGRDRGQSFVEVGFDLIQECVAFLCGLRSLTLLGLARSGLALAGRALAGLALFGSGLCGHGGALLSSPLWRRAGWGRAAPACL
jgi:hypothetical protein